MSLETLNTSTMRHDALVIDLRDRLRPTPLEIAMEIKALREQASLILQAKHLAGKELAHQAVAYLFGVIPSHQIEFVIGHSDPQQRKLAAEQHEGYAAHLDYLSSQGAITPQPDAGLYVAYGTGRILHKLEIEPDETGSPAVIAYRDGDTQRAIELTTGDPRRLIAEA